MDCVKAGTEGTDFFRPAIKILYGKKGATNSFLSVDAGSVIDTNYKLLKIDNPASDISVDYHIKALNIGIVTSAPIFKTVFIKKEQEGSQPKLCLYEKITLEAGAAPKQSLIKCVNRKRAQNAGIFPTVSDPFHTHLSFGAKFLKNNASLFSSTIDANLHSSIIDASLSMVTFSFETLTDLKNKYNLSKDLITILKSNLVSYNLNYKHQELNIVNNLIQVRHLATGFMLIKREVIEKMMVMYPETKYIDDTGFVAPELSTKTYALFDGGVIDNHYFSEDWLFCHRWENIGGKIWADISIDLTHIGVESYSGSLITNILSMNR